MSNKILKSTFLFSIFVLLAQITGLIRDLFLVRYFGAGHTLDAYYLAFKIPDYLSLFYSVFLGSVIFIPLLTEALIKDGEKGVQKVVNNAGSLALTLVLFFSACLYFFMPSLTPLLVPTWDSGEIQLLTELARILLLGQLFFPIGILAGSVGMVYDRPQYFAGAGFIYNFFILLFAILLSPFYGIHGVVYAVIIGSIMFALFQVYPVCARVKILSFRYVVEFYEWWIFFKRNLGRFITVFLNQSFWLAVLSLASFAGAGGVTIFNNAFNVFLAIFYVVGGAFSTAIMPNTAKLHVSGSHNELKDTLHNSLIYMFVISCYIAMFCFLFSKETINTIYYFANLQDIEIVKMYMIFSILVLSIPFLNIIEVVRKYFYTTNMIMQSVTVMLTFLPVMFIVNSFLNNYFAALNVSNDLKTLLILAISILVANIAATFVVLSVLEYYGRLNFKFVFKNIYKVFFIIPLTVLLYKLLQAGYQFVIALLSPSFSIVLKNEYLFTFGFNIILSLSALILSIYILRDKISQNVLRQIKDFVV